MREKTRTAVMRHLPQTLCVLVGLVVSLIPPAPAQSPLLQPAPLAEARSLLDRNQPQPAEAAVRTYLLTHPDSADAHFLLGLILFRQGRPHDSLAAYTEGAKHRTPSAADLKVVGSNYVLLGDYADADKWFTRAVEFSPRDAQAWYYLGRTKYNENRFEEALQSFERCLTLDPRHVKAEDNRGLSYEALGRTDEAAAAYRRAIERQAGLAAQNPEPYFNLGGLLLAQDHPAQALPYLQQAAALAPAEAKMHQRLGKAYLALDQLDPAQTALERAAHLDSNSAPLHYLLQGLYRKQGQTAKADKELQLYRRLQATEREPH